LAQRSRRAPSSTAEPEPQGGAEAGRAAQVVDAPIAEFRSRRPGLYRGARPGDEGLAYLKKLGVRTVVDLEIGDWIEARPAESARKTGRRGARAAFVRRPMSAFSRFVSDDAMNETSPSSRSEARPIYVHCKHGQDRTGLVIGLERVLRRGVGSHGAPGDVSRSDSRAFSGARHYYEEKTGFEDERSLREERRGRLPRSCIARSVAGTVAGSTGSARARYGKRQFGGGAASWGEEHDHDEHGGASSRGVGHLDLGPLLVALIKPSGPSFTV